MVPIHLVPKPTLPDGQPVIPEDPICFLVGSDGVFKQVVNDFYSVRVKTDGVGALGAVGETVALHVPKLPESLFRQIEGFFVKVYKEHQSEAVVLLSCDPEAEKWRFDVPVQDVSGAHVKYDAADLPALPDGFQQFGSIHSHAGMSAFHSGTDDKDETTFNGLHITIGNLDQPVRTYACRWMLSGKAFKAELTDVVDGLPLPEPEPAWLAQVHKPAPSPVDYMNSWYGGGNAMRPEDPQMRELLPHLRADDEPRGFDPDPNPASVRQDNEGRLSYLEDALDDVNKRLSDVEAAVQEDLYESRR